MSLYSALYSGVSGIAAEASAMAATADNITNLNTVGYKGTDSQFSTLVGGSQGARVGYSAGGVTSVSRSLISKQMLLTPTSNSTDLAISGQGFFVTRASKDPTSAVGLTRAGSFSPDKEGNLRNTAGQYLQGWRLDGEGKYTNTGSADDLENIRVSDLTGTASPTSTIKISANFKSTETPVVGYVVGSMSATPPTTTPAFSRDLTVYDAQGGTHQISLSVVKTGENTWAAEFHAKPASDVSGVTDGLLASGTIKFNADGSLDKANSDTALFDPITPTWTNGAGTSPITLSLGDQGSFTGLVSFGDDSSVKTYSVNGGPLGNISSIEVSKEGLVSAVFDDGTSRAVFQLPLATVANPDGLTRIDGNSFQVSSESGPFSINAPGSLGAGDISSFKLEASTTDLAAEFTNMIRFQRAYSAASKIITTVDDMLQEVSNLKR